MLAKAQHDGTVSLYLTRGAHVADLRDESAHGRAHTKAVTSLSFSRDGRFLLTASLDCTVKIWNATTFALSASCKHREEVMAAEFEADSRAFVTGCYDRRVRRFVNAEDGSWGLDREWSRHFGQVWSIAVAPGGGEFVSSSQDGTLHVRASSAPVDSTPRIVAEEHEPALGVAYSPSGERIASSYRDGSVRVWSNPGADPVLRRLESGGSTIFCEAFSPDSRILITGSRSIYVWDVATGVLLDRLTPTEGSGNVRTLAFLPDGVRFLSGSENDDVLRVWNLQTARLEDSRDLDPESSCRIHALAVAPDGRSVLAGGASGKAELVAIDDSGRLGATLRSVGQEGWIRGVAVARDRRLLTCASVPDRTGRVWDPAVPVPVAVLAGHGYDLNAIAFTRDERRAITASGDGLLMEWDLRATTTPLRRFAGHGSSVLGFRLAHSGEWMVSVGRDARALFWDLSNDRPIAAFEDPAEPLFAVDLSADDRYLAMGGAEQATWLLDLRAERRIDGARAEMMRYVAEGDGGDDQRGRGRALAAWYAAMREWSLAAELFDEALRDGEIVDPVSVMEARLQSGDRPGALEWTRMLLADERPERNMTSSERLRLELLERALSRTDAR